MTEWDTEELINWDPRLPGGLLYRFDLDRLRLVLKANRT